MKKFLLCGFIVMFMAMLLLPAVSFVQAENLIATDLTTDLGNIGQSSGLDSTGAADSTNLTTYIGRIIKVVLGFLGIIMLGLVIYGGFLYMTSGGDAEGTKKGKTMITNAVIGLVIILLAYAITSFVISKITNEVILGTG